MPYLLIAVSNILGGSTYAVTTEALKGFAEKDLMLLRMALCAALFVPFIWRGRRRLSSTSRGDRARIVAVGLFGYALPLAMGTYGVKLSSATSASLLVGIEPVTIVLLSAVFLGERLTGLKILSLVLGLTGALLIAFQGPPTLSGAFTDRLKGDLILALHGGCWALYSVLGKSALKRVDPLDFTAVTSIIGFFGVAAWAFGGATPSSWPAAAPAAWLAIAYLAVAGGFLAVILWNVALKKVEASKVANFIFLQPVVGVLLGVGLQGDPLTGWSLAGGGLVLGGMYAAAHS
ncbi:MAG: EamA family transporter [Elusimicrobiota bacterium]|nr:EamA family transporter [Elusimicrobiota bacterium]